MLLWWSFFFVLREQKGLRGSGASPCSVPRAAVFRAVPGLGTRAVLPLLPSLFSHRSCPDSWSFPTLTNTQVHSPIPRNSQEFRECTFTPLQHGEIQVLPVLYTLRIPLLEFHGCCYRGAFQVCPQPPRGATLKQGDRSTLGLDSGGLELLELNTGGLEHPGAGLGEFGASWN